MATTYKDGKKNGVEHAFYPDGATLRYAKSYQHGKLHGLQQHYSQDAILIQEENYEKGRLNGRSRYYENGLLEKEIDYKQGVIDETYREFYPSGVIKLEILRNRGRAIEGYLYDEIGQRTPLSTQQLQRLNPAEFAKSVTTIEN